MPIQPRETRRFAVDLLKRLGVPNAERCTRAVFTVDVGEMPTVEVCYFAEDLVDYEVSTYGLRAVEVES